jgi:isoleucyl-tRNA synthetase
VKFQKNSRRPAIEYEKALINYWKEHKIFEASVSARPADNHYVFYDGPPFITGVPHYGTLLSSIVKDTIPRYWTMKGKRVERVWGWDCHGLPAENFVEQKLGIKDKRGVAEIGLEKYINTCRECMIETGNEWESTIDRIGRWVDFKNAYKTMDKNFMESVWWAFKTLYDKGKIYEGEKVLMYCTRCATPISKAEVAMDNSYQDVTDPSLYVKFKLDDSDEYLLAWTTTPWTLLANVALAVNKDISYAIVEVNNEKIILAKDKISTTLTDDKHQPIPHKIIKTISGQELVGRKYKPLFKNYGSRAHVVHQGDFVSLEEGTGIVHIAPAYGEEDFVLAQQTGLPVVSNIDEYGVYTDGDWKGQAVWEVNKLIAKTLLESGKALKIEYIRHSYPHCYRCGTRLIYKAHPSWFMNIDSQRQQMLEANANINWFPEHIKHGRFEKTVQTAPDWNISRDRFWATPMPVWQGKDTEGKIHTKVIGSYQELADLSGNKLNDYHRPWIDDVTFKIDRITYKRIEKVLDCWFESGAMPFAQFHYPFENVEKFELNFPGDFIAEYVAQVRAWFYYVHAVSIGIFGKEAYKNVIVTGTIAGNDGRKMSKSFGNYTDPNILMDTYSADSLRYALLNSPLLNGEDYILNDKDIADIYRKLNMVWNMYDFFTLYADVDNWQWDGRLEDPLAKLTNVLDIWIASRIHQLIDEVDKYMQKYNIPNATNPILSFIDDASNWYVRRSRKRFWKSTNDKDKDDAYKTLHYVLVTLAHIMAPFTPFMAEELFKNLTDGDDKKSVHLADWPKTGDVNETIIQNMALIRELITIGLAQRAEAGIKVRQPLNSAEVKTSSVITKQEEKALTDIIADELNVKNVVLKKSTQNAIKLDLTITNELKKEGIARELIRYIQNLRKELGFEVDDRIKLTINSEDTFVKEVLGKYSQNIHTEVLSTGTVSDGDDATTKNATIDGYQVEILVKKI